MEKLTSIAELKSLCLNSFQNNNKKLARGIRAILRGLNEKLGYRGTDNSDQIIKEVMFENLFFWDENLQYPTDYDFINLDKFFLVIKRKEQSELTEVLAFCEQNFAAISQLGNWEKLAVLVDEFIFFDRSIIGMAGGSFTLVSDASGKPKDLAYTIAHEISHHIIREKYGEQEIDLITANSNINRMNSLMRHLKYFEEGLITRILWTQNISCPYCVQGLNITAPQLVKDILRLQAAYNLRALGIRLLEIKLDCSPQKVYETVLEVLNSTYQNPKKKLSLNGLIKDICGVSMLKLARQYLRLIPRPQENQTVICVDDFAKRRLELLQKLFQS